MNKIFSISLICLLSILISFCQIKEKAKSDHEFDKGSKIKSIETTEQNVENLAMLCKVWGFLKYYHPNIAKGEYNWDYELFRMLPKLMVSKNTDERDKILLDWVISLGDVDKSEGFIVKESSVKMKPDLDWISKSNLLPELEKQLTKIKNAERSDLHYYVEISSGYTIFKNEDQYEEVKFPDMGYRLLSLFRYWNIVQYYFPYKYLIEEDWKAVLNEFIPKFINDKNELDYKLTIAELIARLHDTHARLTRMYPILMKYHGLNFAPVKIKFIENKAVVVGYYDEVLGAKSGLLKGDVLLKINNRSIEEMIMERLIYSSASNYPTQLRNIGPNLLRTNDTVIEVNFIRNVKTKTIHLKTYLGDSINIYKLPVKDTCLKLINKDIAYINVGSIKGEPFVDFMYDIRDKKGLVIDLRCYPDDYIVYSLGQFLIPKGSKAFVKNSRGNVRTPGLFTYENPLEIKNSSEYFYKGKVVILINEKTQSQAEYTTMAFKVSPNATVIGSTTAGADGDVSTFCLPGGIMTMFTGKGVYYPDGRETQRVGIIPDIEVKPTIEGIKQNRDEVLEKAIQIINGK